MTIGQLEELNTKTKNLLHAVLPEEIIFVDRNKVYIGGKEAGNAEISNLIAEAKFLTDSHIWKLLQGTVGEMARQVMFDKAEKFDDLIAGKSILLALDIFKSIVEKLRVIELPTLSSVINK